MANDRNYGDEKIVYPTTIVLVEDPTPILKMFFCFSSQTPIVQYKGKVISVLPGLSPYEPYTLIKCKDQRCPMAFSFSMVEMSRKYLI